MPSAIFSAVSKDSASRCCRSALTLKRSTTASIVCFLRNSNSGGLSNSIIFPLTRALTNPWALRFSKTSLCSPLRSCTTGASSIILSPSGIANTASTIWLTVCAANACPCDGQRGSPALANNNLK